jgi:hypothetical protein
MHELDTLFALGEVAIGMAGFSAIVVLFKRRDSGRWRSQDADRFNGMLIHAMSAAFFCALPAVLEALIEATATLWAVGSALLGTQIALHAGIILHLPSTRTPTRAVVLLGGLAALTFQLLNVAGVGIPRGFAPYLIGVLWHLLHAGVLFVTLVWVRAEDVE